MTQSAGQRRGFAILSLASGALGVVIAIVSAGNQFPVGLIALVLLLVAAGLAVDGLFNIGNRRLAELIIAVILAVVAIVIVVLRSWWLLIGTLVVIALFAIAIAAASRAFRVSVPLPVVAPPSAPVLIYNRRSGDGKADRLHLADEAERRGYRTIELVKGDDLRALAEGAVADGADALAMAGGDGSQAVVADVAASHDLPYACIPSGTRNHFALDLGVDRDDAVGALDSFVEGGERRVDLGVVNGQVFVNNVSLGVYGEAVQRESYRNAKAKTLLDVASQVLGPNADQPSISWHYPNGTEHESVAAVMVSNNQYRLGHIIGSGTRPSIEDGLLGVAVIADPASRPGSTRLQHLWSEWVAPTFEIDSDTDLNAGIDGEAATLTAPVRFEIRHQVLRARIARRHPGASPSADVPDGALDSVRALFRIALGQPVHVATRQAA